jgi:hypothetical protein
MQKDPFHKELAMRICAAYVSVQMGTTAATQYKHLKARETAGYDVGDAWYFLAQITVRVLAEAQDARFADLVAHFRPITDAIQ